MISPNMISEEMTLIDVLHKHLLDLMNISLTAMKKIKEQKADGLSSIISNGYSKINTCRHTLTMMTRDGLIL